MTAAVSEASWALRTMALRERGQTPGRVGQVYRGLVNRWKLYKTVYNPVTHLNNTYSNVEMLLMADYSAADLGRGIKHRGL